MIAIYATLGLARTLAGVLRDNGLISGAFWVGLWLIGGAIVLQALRMRPSGIEIGVGLGIAGAYLIALLRMAIPEERSHLIEYSVVALLVHQALLERQKNGRSVPYPALLALGITILLGWLDEGIQFFLPNRIYDIRDVVFNALAALMAISASVVLIWARQRFGRQ
ncbi:MAG: VanZ family protein [Chloroflexota bacterium]